MAKKIVTLHCKSKTNIQNDRVWSLAIALCNSGVVIVLGHQAILYY